MGTDGALLTAIEAKTAKEFGHGEAQLLCYLAVLREARRLANKRNFVTQGLYSDGRRFAFCCLLEGEVVQQSKTLNIRDAEDLNLVYSWFVAMLDAAAKSTPTASELTKPKEKRDEEITNFAQQVWGKMYVTDEDPSLADLDANMLDFSDLLDSESESDL